MLPWCTLSAGLAYCSMPAPCQGISLRWAAVLGPSTAQVMMAWNDTQTFSCFFYPAGGLQWVTSQYATSAPAVVGRVEWVHTTWFQDYTPQPSMVV